MSLPSLGSPYLSEEQQRLKDSDEKAFGIPTDPSVKENRRKQIIERFQKIIDDKEIEQLDFKTKDDYSRWFHTNIINIQNMNDYDHEEPRIRPLYIAIRIRYYHKYFSQFNGLLRYEKQMLLRDIQKLTELQKNELKQKLQVDGYSMDGDFIKSLFAEQTLGGSRRKQSKRRLRKTQHRRKRNNRKSKKTKQV